MHSTPKECTNTKLGDPFGVVSLDWLPNPGVLATLVPPVTESGRFQRPFPRLLKVHTFGVLPHENDQPLVIW